MVEKEDRTIIAPGEKLSPSDDDLYSVFFVEFIHTSRGIDNFLLARIKGMTLRANVNVQLFGQCGFDDKRIATATFHSNFMIRRVYIGFHCVFNISKIGGPAY